MQVTVPAQHSVGSHQQPQTAQARSGQGTEQRGQPRPIGRLEPDPLLAELAVQYRELVPQGEDLRILSVHADEGPTLKRFRPRAMGRATRIRKRTSHLTITLTPKES